MLQVGKKRVSWSWSKTGRKRWIAPSREKASELELEQNRKKEVDCSKSEKREQAGVGAKQEERGRLLRVGKKRASWSRSKTGIKWSIAPSREKASKLD